MKALQDPDFLVLHQVHPAKLAADAGSGLASFWLLWRGHTVTGLVVHYGGPLLASALVLRGEVSHLRHTARGRYVLTRLPASTQAIRAIGDTLMVRGARKKEPKLIAAGALAVGAGWAAGLLSPATRLAPPVGPEARVR
ncbi:MAG: hypothetical protein NVSMB32_05860 [Actinomycetota bacterium]